MKQPIKFFLLFMVVCGILIFFSAQAADLQSGDLVKASGDSVYYYGGDGKRYVFPNEKTYKTWYSDFSAVRTITDQELAAIQIGGNVTYKPGSKMVKITTSPTVYAVDAGGTLRAINSEETARSLYGDDWNTKIDDIPDTFFINYIIGQDINFTSDYDPVAVEASATDIYRDKQSRQTSTQTPAPNSTPSPTPSQPAQGTSFETAVYIDADTEMEGTSMAFEYVEENSCKTNNGFKEIESYTDAANDNKIYYIFLVICNNSEKEEIYIRVDNFIEDGSSVYNAIVIEAENETEGVQMEYDYVEANACPDNGGYYTVMGQELYEFEEHIYDELYVVCNDGYIFSYIFLIDSFYGIF